MRIQKKNSAPRETALVANPKRPRDTLHKILIALGIVIVLVAISPLYFWNLDNLEAIKLQEQIGTEEAECNRWSMTSNLWRRALFLREDIKAQIRRKQERGPTAPLTKAEEAALIAQLPKLPQPANSVSPESAVALINAMRELEREAPTMEELNTALDLAERAVGEFEKKGEKVTDFEDKIEKTAKRLEADKAHSAYLQYRAKWLLSLSAAGIIFGATLISFGRRSTRAKS